MRFENCKYSIEMDSKGSIISLKSNGKEFINSKMPLFQFRLRTNEVTQIITSDTAETILKKNTEKLFIEYKFKEAKITFNVTVLFKDRLEFSFGFENNTNMYVEWVDFPQISVPNDLKGNGGSGKLIYNMNEGLLIEDFSAKEKSGQYKYRDPEYPSLGLNSVFPAAVESQFLAYYDNRAGIYVASEDRERAIKGIDFAPSDNNGIKIQFRLYPGIKATETNYTLPYNMVYDFFTGEWHQAAELYRNWFSKNLPDNLKKVSDNNQLPEWYFDSPLVVAYPVQGVHDMDEAVPNKLFPYNNALPHLDEISLKTNSRILTALMHWEGTAPWAPPYVWPPLGGEEMLKDFCDNLHKRNHMLGLYCSGISYTVHSNINDFNCEKEIEDKCLLKYMCAPPDSGKPTSQTCQAQRLSYDMCISQDFTKNVLCDEAKKMASCGLDYIQILDQNHGGSPYYCYSNQHSHPAVPGKWMVEHNIDLLKRLKENVGDKVLLGCESAAAESYIPYLNLSDNRFNLNYVAGKPIPLYGYIYHEYLHNFSGNSVCSLFFIDSKKSPDCYLLRMAHSFLAGDLMTVVINQDGEIMWSWGQREFSDLPDREPIFNFIKSATSLRRGVGKDYLVYGKMVKPKEFECEEVPIFSLKMQKDLFFPAVMSTAWEAIDGTKAQILATYRNKSEKCKIDLSSTNGALLFDENGNEIIKLAPKVTEFEIPATSVRMLKFL